MTRNGKNAAPAETMRRLDDPAAAALAKLVEVFEDLQAVLRCCERLVSELAVEGDPDEVVVESVWTTALLSYARCFSPTETDVALTEDDVRTTHTAGDEVVKWHRLLLQLRDHYADASVNPRERFSVGVTQGPDGTASGVAITSARQPLVDDLTVRQTGAIGYALSAIVNARIESGQQQVFEELKNSSRADLDRLELVEVAAGPDAET
jgi:hypothetical protein